MATSQFRKSAFIIAIALPLALTACARPFGSGNDFELKKPTANPSAVVAAESAFNRLAREEGLWTAFRELAADNAIMLTPEPVAAETWLKGRADPELAPQWEPEAIYMSCDARTAASTGGFVSAVEGGEMLQGQFTTIWQRRYEVRAAKADWKFLFDHGVNRPPVREKPDFVQTRVASCNGAVPQNPPQANVGYSRDQTLKWEWDVRADTSRKVTVSLWNGSAYEAVIIDDIEAR